MRLRTKMVLCNLLLLSAAVAVIGMVLITQSFRFGLESEKAKAVQAYEAVRQSLLQGGGYRMDFSGMGGLLEAQTPEGLMGISLLGDGGDAYTRGSLPPNEVSGGHLYTENECYFLAVGGDVKMNEDAYRLTLNFDISAPYAARQQQAQVYYRALAVTLAASAAASILYVSLFTRPLEKLSRTAREIAAGDLSKRAEVRTRDEAGQLAGNFNVMADKLAADIHALEDSLHRQEEFMGSVAHELKTPMTSIIGYADLLLEQSLDREETAWALRYIRTEGVRLEGLSGKLLELIVLQKEDFQFVPHSLAALFGDMLAAMKPSFQKQGVTLAYRFAEGQCLVEPHLVKSLLINLLHNGKKAGGTEMIVLGELTPQGCRLTVRDNGRGIPPEALERLTEAFYRVDKARARAQGGAGLGLALCERIARLHGGTLAIYSQVGKGTEVTVTLERGRVQCE